MRNHPRERRRTDNLTPTLRLSWRASALRLLILGVLLLAGAARAEVLRFAGDLHDTDGSLFLRGAHGITVSPDGHDVYVVSFDDNALILLDRDETGGVQYSTALVNGVGGVSGLFRAVDVTVSPDGRDVYVAAFFGDAVSGFRRDQQGGLTFTQSVFGGANGTVGLTQLQGVAVSPDGENVYVASYGDNAVTALSRDPQTGLLQVLAVYIDGENGVRGVFRAAGVAISPDGGSVYVAGGGSNAVAAFARAANGELQFLEDYVQGEDGIAGLDDVLSLAPSADGNDLYALGSSGLAHFRRAKVDGLLTFAGVQTEGVVNESGTSGPTSVSISPDGQYLYVTRGGDDTLSVLARDAATGALQFVESHRNGEAGVSGLAGASSVAVSPDSGSVYVAAQFADSVVRFSRSAACVGDCNGDGEVTVDEIVVGVNIALEAASVSDCLALDSNADGEVTVDEIVHAVNNSLGDCAL